MTYKIIFVWKNQTGIKNAEFHADFKSFEKVFKNVQKKLLAKMWRKYALFPLLLMFIKLVLLITFVWGFFLKLFQRIWNQHEILRFLKPFLFKTFFLRSYEYFFQTLKPNAQKRRQKSKNVLSKCVLDLNFAAIKGSVFLIFKKMSNSLYPPSCPHERRN
jgi:hypothetical protein